MYYSNYGFNDFNKIEKKKELPLPSTVYYFAYGSNMSRKRMQKRGLIWEKITKATLKNWSLKFNKIAFDYSEGFANIEKAKGRKVEGVLYKLEEKEQAHILDKYESTPDHYRRIEVYVRTEKGQSIKAFTYIANKRMIEKGLYPSEDYLNHLLDGKRYLSAKYHHGLKQIKTLDNSELDMPLHVFVYGTLKKGFGNHDHYCSDAISIESARLDGELYDSGLPYVHINQKNIFAKGTQSNYRDFQKQEDLEDSLFYGDSFTQLGNPFVEGELITFSNWDSLKRLDSLEGFTGDNKYNHYTRVLTTCYINAENQECACWVYVIDKFKMRLETKDLCNNGMYRSSLNYDSKSFLNDEYYYSAVSTEYGDIPELYIDIEEEEEEKDLVDLFENANF